MYEQLELFETKACVKCGATKPIEDFATRDRGAYHRTECKDCAYAESKIRKKLKEQNPPPSEDHRCPICLGSVDDVKGLGGKNNSTWCLDHNHKTKQFRGWLCHKCNRGIGAFDVDDCGIEKIIRLINYISEDNV